MLHWRIKINREWVSDRQRSVLQGCLLACWLSNRTIQRWSKSKIVPQDIDIRGNNMEKMDSDAALDQGRRKGCSDRKWRQAEPRSNSQSCNSEFYLIWNQNYSKIFHLLNTMIRLINETRLRRLQVTELTIYVIFFNLFFLSIKYTFFVTVSTNKGCCCWQQCLTETYKWNHVVYLMIIEVYS